MFLARLPLASFLVLAPSHAWAQSNPGFIEGNHLCANYPSNVCAQDSPPNPLSLNQAFANKQDYLSQCKNIEAFRGKGDNTTDNVTPYNNAIASFATAGKCIYFPSGKYKFNTTPNVWSTGSPADSLVIIGDGADATELTFPTVGTGVLLNLQTPTNSVHLRNFSLTTGTNGVGGYGLRIVMQSTPHIYPANDAPNDIYGVTIRGADGYNNAGVNYWSSGAIIDSASNINWVNNYFIGASAGGAWQSNGIGLIVRGSYSGGSCQSFPVAHNFTNLFVNMLGTGVQIGECVQGLAFTSSNFTGGYYGISLPAGLHANTELAVMGSQFNQFAAGISINSSLNNTTIHGNTFYMPGADAVGVSLGAGSGGLTVIGNNFNALGGSNNTGIAVNEGGVSGSIVSGNVFYNSSGPASRGVSLQSGSSNILVINNAFYNLANNIVNSGSNNIIYGNLPEYYYTIATLPACNAAADGQRLKVSDGVAAPTYLAAVSATGTSKRSVMCAGASWIYN